MRTDYYSDKLRKSVLIAVFCLVVLNVFIFPVRAQFQDFYFSGSSAESYQCIGLDGNIDPSVAVVESSGGMFVCEGVDRDGDGEWDPAILKPPKFQQLEIWFVKILYSVWALVGTFSFFMLAYLGYQAMLRGGTTDDQLVKLRKHILSYILGVALVFLAVPILESVFRLMGINKEVDCYNVDMPGFQFFFSDLCTDPKGQIADQLLSDPCSVPDASGITCGNVYRLSQGCEISGSGGDCYWYECSQNAGGIWVRVGPAPCSLQPNPAHP